MPLDMDQAHGGATQWINLVGEAIKSAMQFACGFA
jgi:hypothetical protein